MDVQQVSFSPERVKSHNVIASATTIDSRTALYIIAGFLIAALAIDLYLDYS